MRSTLRRLLPALAGAAAFLILVWPVFDPEMQLFFRDTGRLYYPVKKYIAERLRHGELAFWDPWVESGISLLGQMSPGLLHPWTLLYLVFPFDLAFKLNHLLPLLLAGVGLYLLARRLEVSRTGAFAGALLFGGCGYLVSQAAANLIYVVGPAGVPLALERFVAFLDKPSRGKLVAASALLALCAYGGEPQSMLMGGLIGAAFALSFRPRALGLVAAWGALAVALSAPVALPAASQLLRSKRAGGVNAKETKHFAVSPWRLPGFVLPNAFDDSPAAPWPRAVATDTSPFREYFDDVPFSASIYLGSAALLLACFAFVDRRGRFFLLGGLVLALAATGENLGVQTWLNRLIPGYSLFRYAEKQAGFASLLLAVAAAFGLDAAFDGSRKKKALIAGAAASTAAFAAAGTLLVTRADWFHDWFVSAGTRHSHPAASALVEAIAASVRQEAAVLAAVATVALVALLWPRLPGKAIVAAICGAALVASARSQLVTLPVKLFHEPPPLAKQLTAMAGPSAGRWRLYVRPTLEIYETGRDPRWRTTEVSLEPLYPHFDSLFGIEGMGIYFSIDDLNYSDLVASEASRASYELLTLRFFVAMPGALSKQRIARAGFEQTYFGMWMLTAPPPGPRARLLDRVEVEGSMEALLLRLQRVDWSRTALLLPADAAAVRSISGAAGSPGDAALNRISPEEMAVSVEAAATSVLEVGEHYDPGWSATVDGEPAKTVAVDGAILGAVVPAGRHEVRLTFNPVGLFLGLIVAFGALIVVFSGPGVLHACQRLLRSRSSRLPVPARPAA
ncbi:MAG TPA: YfhO family protein [Myxococcales bacterium]|nr:YfhO family protein [Myxococcales bacterium]